MALVFEWTSVVADDRTLVVARYLALATDVHDKRHHLRRWLEHVPLRHACASQTYPSANVTHFLRAELAALIICALGGPGDERQVHVTGEDRASTQSRIS